MVAALAVAALFVRAGTDNPAALDVTAAHRARAAALVERLGDRQFAERDTASRELDGMGRLALLAVRAGRRSNDAEVRQRCDRLLPAMETAELAARLAVFLADDAGRYEHRVPGWELFRAAAGGDRPARGLFAEIARERANWPLLAALRGPGVDVRGGLLAMAGGVGAWADRPPPVRAAQAGAVRRWEFLAAQEAPPAVGADDDAPPAKPVPPAVPDVALVVLAETLHPERMAVKNKLLPPDFVNSFFNTKPGRDGLTGQGRFGPALARLGRVWLDTRDEDGVFHAYMLAKHIRLDDATLTRYAGRVLVRRSLPADARLECLARLTADKTGDHLGLFLSQFDDIENVGSALFRDLALVAALDRTGQPPADYGITPDGRPGPFVPPADTKPEDYKRVEDVLRVAAFARWLNGPFVPPSETKREGYEKVVNALRAAAFARWRDWEATRFGAVVGPAVVVGARTVP